MAEEFVDYGVNFEHPGIKAAKDSIRGRSAKAISAQLLSEFYQKNLSEKLHTDIKGYQSKTLLTAGHDSIQHRIDMDNRAALLETEQNVLQPLDALKYELREFNSKSSSYFKDTR